VEKDFTEWNMNLANWTGATKVFSGLSYENTRPE
jgi:hypothetical protein